MPQQPGQSPDQLTEGGAGVGEAGGRGRDVDNTNNNNNNNNNNVDDSRFDVPTNEPSQNGPNGSNNNNNNINNRGGTEVLYQDGGNGQGVNGGGGGAGLLNVSDIFSTTASIDFDVKLR